MEIRFRVIPHNQQRYETVGDYFETTNGAVEFRVSDMANSDYEFAVFIHELIEWYLYTRKDKSIEAIDEFDKAFEKIRILYPKIIGEQEPGHMISAPYHVEHVFAETIERQLIDKMDLDWNKYNDTVERL